MDYKKHFALIWWAQWKVYFGVCLSCVWKPNHTNALALLMHWCGTMHCTYGRYLSGTLASSFSMFLIFSPKELFQKDSVDPCWQGGLKLTCQFCTLYPLISTNINRLVRIWFTKFFHWQNRENLYIKNPTTYLQSRVHYKVNTPPVTYQPGIIFELVQPMWLWYLNVTDWETDGQTTCHCHSKYCALCRPTVSSRVKNYS